MIEIRPRETVILAANFSALVAWYREILGFTIVKLFEEDFHFCNLTLPSGIHIGIADADEMGVVPIDRGSNSVVLQFEVDDVQEFFAYLKQEGATITNGPSFDANDNYWFGSFTDPEGNPIWVVDKNCP
jgi:uncharacterized glyoxalase superfamily protein PhnB